MATTLAPQLNPPIRLPDYFTLLAKELVEVKETEKTVPSIPLRGNLVELAHTEITEKVRVFNIEKFLKKHGVKLADVLDSNELPLMPSRAWFSPRNRIERDYTIRDAIEVLNDTVGKYVGIDFTRATRQSILDNTFASSTKLYQIVNSNYNVDIKIGSTNDGGLIILGKVSSFTEPEIEYKTAIFLKKNQDDSVTVYSGCTCPLVESNTRLICKHKIALMMSALPHILSYIKYGDVFEEHVKEAQEIVKELFEKGEGREEAIIYYLTKVLLIGGSSFDIYGGTIRSYGMDILAKILDPATPVSDYLDAKERVRSITTPREKVLEAIYSAEASELRRKILAVMDELSEELGRVASRDMVIALMAQAILSANSTEPPKLGLFVGEPGTDKTTSFLTLARHLTEPHLRFRASPTNYYKLVEIIGRYLKIPVSDLIKKNNIFINDLNTEGGMITGTIDLHNISSFLVKIYGNDFAKKLSDLITEVMQVAEIEYIKRRIRTIIVDNTKTSLLSEDLTYVPLGETGELIASRLVFNGKQVLLDEFLRQPGATKYVLTVLSTVDIMNHVRFALDTENPEPYIEAIRDPENNPYRSRMLFGVFTPQIFDIEKQIKALSREPTQTIDLVELLATYEKVVKNIPAPEIVSYLSRAILNYMTYVVALIEIDDMPVEVIVPIDKYDIVKENNYDLHPAPNFEAIRDARFPVYTVQMAKFLAFLEGHGSVTFDDFKNALKFTLMPRIQFRDPSFMQLEYFKIYQHIVSMIDEATSGDNLTLIYKLIKERPVSSKKLEKLFEELHKRINKCPLLGHLYMGALETLYILKGTEIFKELPKRQLASLFSIIIMKGDATDQYLAYQYDPELFSKVSDALSKLISGE